MRIMNEAYESASDEALMEQVCRGSRQALAALVERHHPPLMGYLYRLTNGQRELAEDLAQETFLKILQSAALYERERAFKPWLYTIATNRARDHFRRLETRKTDDWYEWIEERPGQVDLEPETAFLTRENQGRAAAAVQQLSPPLRAALILRFYNDLSLEEIAQALDLPLGTVKSRLSNAVRQLQRILAEPQEV